MPKRIQRKRTKGWKLPDNTVCVSRPSKFGNPYKVVPFGKSFGVLIPALEDNNGMVLMGFDRLFKTRYDACTHAVELFKDYLEKLRPFGNAQLEELRGKDLACWCREDEPCHADILLEMANS